MEAEIRLQVAEALLSSKSIAVDKISNLSIHTIPKGYGISQNYPNPFNPNTSIDYQLPKDGLVVIKIYDILGNEIKTLINENKPAGSYTVIFNASKLSSGVYIYRIAAGDFTASKKMTLIK